MNFATIFDGKVQNIITANNKEIAEQVTGLVCVPFTDDNPAHIGYGYDGKTFEQPAMIVEKPSNLLDK